MNTISYDINYFNEAFINEIEELCDKPYHIYWEIQLWFKIVKAKRILRKTEKSNLFFIESLYKIDFTTVLDVEKSAKHILDLSTTIVNGCSQCQYTKCKEKFSDIYFIPLMVSFEKVLKAIQNSYHLNADDIFKTEKEYKENNEALKVFSDIWNYETPDEDKEFIFKHNAELTDV